MLSQTPGREFDLDISRNSEEDNLWSVRHPFGRECHTIPRSGPSLLAAATMSPLLRGKSLFSRYSLQSLC
jgi:hypothetical protein